MTPSPADTRSTLALSEVERVVRAYARSSRAAGEGPERMIVSLKQALRAVVDPHDSLFPRLDEQVLGWSLDEYYAPHSAVSSS